MLVALHDFEVPLDLMWAIIGNSSRDELAFAFINFRGGFPQRASSCGSCTWSAGWPSSSKSASSRSPSVRHGQLPKLIENRNCQSESGDLAIVTLTDLEVRDS